MQRASFRLVEECAGSGELEMRGIAPRPVRYAIARYQGVLEGSGMPIPGLHRIEGSLEIDGTAAKALIGRDVTLRLEDGRTLPITVADATGRVLAEGHGPARGCSCC